LESIRQYAASLNHFSGYAIMALAVVQLALVFFMGLYAARWWRFGRRWRDLMRGASGQNLESVLYEQLRVMMRVEEQLKQLDAVSGDHEKRLRRCLQAIGFMRFDAFDDVGGEQSFSLAMLNEESDGVVVSTVYGRSEWRVYAKSIKGGTAVQALTEEERKALAQARERRT
jgi:hypothetical protein